MPSDPEKEPGGKFRRISLSFSFTSLLTLVFLVVVAMTAAYIWGVMTGRAQSSSTREQEAEPVVAVTGSEEQPENRILQAHELQFAQVLRGESPAPKPVPQPPVSEKPAQEPVPAKPVQEPAPAKPVQAPAVKVETPPSPQPSQGQQVWDYLYQVAALKDEQAVDSLRQKLEGEGLRTRMERSGKLYLVMVLIRGDESRVAELARIAELLRLGEPLLRSRKVVNP